MSVEVLNNTELVKAEINSRKGVVVRLMLEDAHRISMPKTPLKDNSLRTSVTKTMEGNSKGTIEWIMPYASYQERGMRADGSHVVRNYTTAGTGPHFAEDSVKKVMENLVKYAIQGGLA